MASEETVRKLDLAAKASIDVVSLNNKVVKMRPIVRRAKLYVINDLTKKIKKLRAKKGTDVQKEKNKNKADRLLEEMSVIKVLKPDYVSKYALGSTEKFDQLVMKASTTMDIRALARLSEQKFINDFVTQFRTGHSDWKELTAYLMTKQTSREFKKKLTKGKFTKIETNVRASEMLIQTYLGDKLAGEEIDTAVTDTLNTVSVRGDKDSGGSDNDDSDHSDGSRGEDSDSDNSSEEVEHGSKNSLDSVSSDKLRKKDIKTTAKATKVNVKQLQKPTERVKANIVNVKQVQKGTESSKVTKTTEPANDIQKPSLRSRLRMLANHQVKEEEGSASSNDVDGVEGVSDSNIARDIASSDSDNGGYSDDNDDEDSSDARDALADSGNDSDASDQSDSNRVNKGITGKHIRKTAQENNANKQKSKEKNSKKKVQLKGVANIRPVVKEKSEGEMIIRKLNLENENANFEEDLPKVLVSDRAKSEKPKKRIKDSFFACSDSDGGESEENEDDAGYDEHQGHTQNPADNTNQGLNAFTTTFVGSLNSDKMMQCNDRQYKSNQEWKNLRHQMKDGQNPGRGRGFERGRGFAGGRGARGRGRGGSRGDNSNQDFSSDRGYDKPEDGPNNYRGSSRGRGPRGSMQGRGRGSTGGRAGHPGSANKERTSSTPTEKLHPSWEASMKRKQQQTGVLQSFTGKKIKFDD